jgi:membrane associated rhomboid family serine protease
MWFVFQLISGLGVLGGDSQLGGVAYAAHVGGFVVGLALVLVFKIGRNLGAGRAAPWNQP